jgi:carbon-monoxide dehydrogenase medium subunit
MKRAISINVNGVTSVEAALAGNELDEQAIADAASHATDGIDANSDLYASEEYRRYLAAVHTGRAINRAQ